MKTIFRLSMVMAVAALLVWGGVAEPGEYIGGLDPEYLTAMDRGELPSTPIEPYALTAPEVEGPVPGTWEYTVAIMTGNLPSSCANEPCGPEVFVVEEVGGIAFRVPLDVGP